MPSRPLVAYHWVPRQLEAPALALGGPTIADAVLDRLVHDAHRLPLKGRVTPKNRPPRLDSIENGAWSATVGARLTELEREQVTLRAEIAASDVPAPVLRLHPNAAELYRDKVAALESSLSEPPIRQEAAGALRALIDRVVLTPDAGSPDALAIELSGDLAVILRMASGRPVLVGAAGGSSCSVAASQLSVVAGTRSHLCRSVSDAHSPRVPSPSTYVLGS